MAHLSENENVTDLIEEELEEEKLFLEMSNKQNELLTPGMRHSATTDTLDSVYLDPPTAELDIDSEPKIDIEIVSETGDKNITSFQGTSMDSEVKPMQTMSDVDDNSKANIVFDVESEIKEETSPPSLSKYFGKVESTEDFFASLPHAEEDLPPSTDIDIGSVSDSKPGGEENVMSGSDPFGLYSAPDKSEEKVEQQADRADEMADLTLNSSADVLQFDDMTLEDTIDTKNETCDEKSDKKKHEFVGTVDFDLALDGNDIVETPVDVEEKDGFESFTAELSNNEALDALGISPAAPSFMNDNSIKEYFRQASSQSDDPFGGVSRQISHTSGRSSTSQERVLGSLDEVTENGNEVPEHVQNSDTSIPAPDLSATIGTGSDSVETTPRHQPLFPPSTTLSPGESPSHQPFFKHSDSQSSGDHSIPAFQSFGDSSSTDDTFSVALQMSDSDRQHDAWLPSDNTKNILITMATHAPGSYIPTSDLLVAPSLVSTQQQGDPVRELVFRYMGEQEALKRKVLTLDSVPRDVDGLKQLLGAGCYRSAIDLTTELITHMGQSVNMEVQINHSPQTLQVWYTRFSLMMKLRLYSVLESEFVAFKNLDTPDMYYEYYPHLFPGKRGSMVPFGMRLLHAELPHHLGRSAETLDRFYYLLAITKRILKNLAEGLSEDGSALTISNESRKGREKKILYLIANTLVLLRDYDAALSVYEDLMEKDSGQKLALLSGLGRIHLQIGNLTKASEFFQQVKATCEGDSATLHMNKGFEAMCQNNFTEAYESFKLAVQADPSNTSAVNNMSVCCLYLGKLKEALTALEALVHGSPEKNLHEGILFNLCTLYELESSRALHKKQALLDLVSKHKGDGFPVRALEYI
ncbi:TPC12-like protein [Mya arenaria]|uniref:TPC12-like protein n=1 Tax=Mya arenaria TaxID=6604 RepID=A0ABY7FNM1_MYAAR|nr:TPC12-like protein [Mya arenaria]